MFIWRGVRHETPCSPGENAKHRVGLSVSPQLPPAVARSSGGCPPHRSLPCHRFSLLNFRPILTCSREKAMKIIWRTTSERLSSKRPRRSVKTSREWESKLKQSSQTCSTYQRRWIPTAVSSSRCPSETARALPKVVGAKNVPYFVKSAG